MHKGAQFEKKMTYFFIKYVSLRTQRVLTSNQPMLEST